jgi:hypothetical protein
MGLFKKYLQAGKELKTTRTHQELRKLANELWKRLNKTGKHVNAETIANVKDAFKQEFDLTEADMTPILTVVNQLSMRG